MTVPVMNNIMSVQSAWRRGTQGQPWGHRPSGCCLPLRGVRDAPCHPAWARPEASQQAVTAIACSSSPAEQGHESPLEKAPPEVIWQLWTLSTPLAGVALKGPSPAQPGTCRGFIHLDHACAAGHTLCQLLSSPQLPAAALGRGWGVLFRPTHR